MSGKLDLNLDQADIVVEALRLLEEKYKDTNPDRAKASAQIRECVVNSVFTPISMDALDLDLDDLKD